MSDDLFGQRGDALRDARLHAGRGVLGDGVVLRRLVDGLEKLGKHLGRRRSLLFGHELADLLHDIPHLLLAAQIENTAPVCDALCFLG